MAIDNDRSGKAATYEFGTFTVRPAQWIRTFSWAIRRTPPYDDMGRPQDAVQWMLFLFVASASLVSAMLVFNQFTVHTISLAHTGSDPLTNVLPQVAGVVESASQVNADLRAFKLGRMSLCLVLGVVIWMAFVACIAAAANIRVGPTLIDRKRFEGTCYVLAAHTLACSLAYVSVAGALILLQIMGMPLPKIMDGDLGPGLYAFGCMLLSIFVTGAIQLCRRTGGKGLALPRTTIALTLTVPLVPLGLLEIDRLAGKWTVPKLHISTSFQCDQADCFAYVRSENVSRLVVDSLIRATVITRYRNPKTLLAEEGYFEARIYVTEPDAKMGPPTIEPGVDKVVRVQKVIVNCAPDKVKDRIYMPIALKPGIAYVYVSGSGRGDGWRQIDVEVSRRFMHSLFRSAEGDCKSDLIF